jgi:hypothetical protein
MNKPVKTRVHLDVEEDGIFKHAENDLHSTLGIKTSALQVLRLPCNLDSYGHVFTIHLALLLTSCSKLCNSAACHRHLILDKLDQEHPSTSYRFLAN